MAQGDTFADRVIAGIGKDLEARVSMLEGRAASARTAVEARMGAYIEMYAGGDDTIAASVDDYRYYQDELESLRSSPPSKPPPSNTTTASTSC